MNKSSALLLLIGLASAVTAGNQVLAQSPSAGQMRRVQSGMTPTTIPSPGQIAGSSKVRSQDSHVSLNFTNVDISALVKLMSELTQRNFILDDRVTGKVTIMTPTRISPDEAYQVFLSALEIKGFTAVEEGRITRIIPVAIARQSGLKVVQDGDGSGQGFITKLLRMNFVNPQEITRTIMPLLTKDGNLIAYPATNSIILTDSVSNIRKIESAIKPKYIIE